LLFRLTQQRDIRARSVQRLGLRARGIGFGAIFSEARQLRLKRGDAAFSAGIARGLFTLSAACGGSSGLSRAAGIARSGFGVCRFRFGGFGGAARGFCFGGSDFGLVQPRFRGAQGIALGKTHSTRRGRAGVMRMAIPTPDRAFFRHQRLARPQPRL